MPNLSVANSPGILSSHTARTLKTEIREQPESKGGFWDKFKSLSLGQKIGRSSATIGSGLVAGGGGVGIGMAAGLGLGLATGGIALLAFGIGALGFYGVTRLARSSKESARVVRQEECRPRETKIQKSESTLPTRENIPLKCTTVLGADARREVATDLLDQIISEGVASDGPGVGLFKAFLPDLHRSEFAIQDTEGRVTHFGRSSFENDGKDLANLSEQDKSAVIEGQFKKALASETSFGGDQDKIAKWQKMASSFMNQTSVMRAQGSAVMASGLQLAERKGDYRTQYNLRIEPGGNSAILECVETGGLNGINAIDENGNLQGNSWHDPESALDFGIDRDATYLKKVTVLRLTLEDEGVESSGDSAKQVRNGMGVEVLSYNSSYSIGLMSQADYDNKIAERDAKQLKENENKYQLHLMGRQPLSGWEVLNLEKNLIPDSGEYSNAIANGTVSPMDIQKMVDKCYERLAMLANQIPARDDVEDEERAAMAQKTMPGKLVAEKYPLSLENSLGEKFISGSGVRDFDLQEFAESKAREEVGTRLLGITPEAYFSAIKPLGAKMVLGGTFLSDQRLHPISQKLRSDLVEAFEQSTTLDDFYSKAQTLIDNARIEASKLSLNQQNL